MHASLPLLTLTPAVASMPLRRCGCLVHRSCSPRSCRPTAPPLQLQGIGSSTSILQGDIVACGPAVVHIVDQVGLCVRAPALLDTLPAAECVVRADLLLLPLRASRGSKSDSVCLLHRAPPSLPSGPAALHLQPRRFGRCEGHGGARHGAHASLAAGRGAGHPAAAHCAGAEQPLGQHSPAQQAQHGVAGHVTPAGTTCRSCQQHLSAAACRRLRTYTA